jgi:hypothetical protein
MRYPLGFLIFSFFAWESAHLPTNSAEDPIFLVGTRNVIDNKRSRITIMRICRNVIDN